MAYEPNIQMVLADRELTQNELARRCGIDAANMSRIATGKSRPRVDTALRIAEELEVAVEELFKT